MAAALIQLSPKDWSKLRDLYKDSQLFASSYNTLQMFINWYEKNPQIDVQIYSLDNDWEQDGTFIAYTSHQIICNTLNKDLTRLTTALKMFNAGSVFVIGGFREHVLPAVKSYIAQQTDEFHITPTIWYNIQNVEVENFNTSAPKDLKIEKLNIKYAAKINSYWAHSWPGAIKFVEDMILYNESAGAFDVDGNLVGWCLVNPIGTLALLHVLDTHKRQGIGSLLTRYLAKELLKHNLQVLTSVVNENFASRGLYEKLNFKPNDNVYWAHKKFNK